MITIHTKVSTKHVVTELQFRQKKNTAILSQAHKARPRGCHIY